MGHLKVIAHLSSPLAGDAPYLDALLEYQMSLVSGRAVALRRNDPAPAAGSIHIPMLRGSFGGVDRIPRCSAPICIAESIRHEHVAKRIAVEHADCLSDAQRLVVATSNSWTKAYRLPLKTANVDRVVWFVGGNNNERDGKRSSRKMLLSLLRRVNAIGKKVSMGFGRVAKWEVENIEQDHSWFSITEHGPMLMRTLPFCDAMPAGLIGYKRDFGACMAPMWHPDRFMEIVVPC